MRSSPRHQTIGYVQDFHGERSNSINNVVPELTARNARIAAKSTAGASVPVCIPCFEAKKSDAVMMMKSSSDVCGWKRGLCSCLKKFQDEVKNGWYCLDCALECRDTKFRTPIQVRLDHLRPVNRDYNASTVHGQNLRYACGVCERKRVRLKFREIEHDNLRWINGHDHARD